MSVDQTPPSADATGVREAFKFDEARLAAYLSAHVKGFEGPLTVEQFTKGQSNPTYLLRTPGREYVLRRKPPGQVLASAHAVDREYRVMSALGRHTNVPVPETYALCTDESVIGTWFFVMERVQGRIFWDITLPEIAAPERAAYFDAMNATIAALHSADFAAIGLADYGKPGDYARRQIKRWAGQYLQDVADAGRVPDMDALIEWLSANVPASDEASVVHGDFRCDNLIFHPTEPRVLAILDWELSTLGHPLADFAYHLMMYYVPDMAIPGLLGKDLATLGIPTKDQYVAAYCQRIGQRIGQRTGRQSQGIPDLDFYVAFNFFRFAAICHGIRGRLTRGTAVSARAREYAAGVEKLAALGRALAG
jgi:aminoglycoside phosphotransferase (APT) family kinase protein